MKRISNTLVRVLMYVFGYANIIAAVVGCGYVLLKDEDEGNCTAAKRSLILVALFVALKALNELYYYIAIRLIGASGAALDVYSVFGTLITLAQIITFAAFAILAIVEGSKGRVTGSSDGQPSKKPEKAEKAKKDETVDADETAEEKE